MSALRQIEFSREALPPLAVLEREWRSIEAIGRPSFFTSWTWIGTLLNSLPDGSMPGLLRGFIGDKTVALALIGATETRRRRMLIRSRGLYLNETGDPHFDSIAIEHNSILADREYQSAVLNGLIGWFATLHDEADELHLRGSFCRWPREAVEGRGLGRVEVTVPSYLVDLSRLAKSGGALYPVLSPNARYQLRRAVREFEQFGTLNLTEATTVDEGLAYFAALKELHSSWWERRGKAHAFSATFFEPFHRRLIETSIAQGATQLLKASVGSRVIGYLYNFRFGERIYAYQSGFISAGRHERPGAVTHALAIQHAYRAGARIYDFMAGYNRLKDSFSTDCEPMLWQVVQQPRIGFQLERLARRLKPGAWKARPSPRRSTVWSSVQ